jgi:hypothetical protein
LNGVDGRPRPQVVHPSLQASLPAVEVHRGHFRLAVRKCVDEEKKEIKRDGCFFFTRTFVGVSMNALNDCDWSM